MLLFSERNTQNETALNGSIYDDESHKRVIETLYRGTKRNDRVFGSVKKVCGGAFSGHNAHFTEGEGMIIKQMVAAKSAFKFNDEIMGWAEQGRKDLHIVVRPILNTIKDTFGHEVNVYLKHFAKVLADTENTLKWDWRTNNCQTFTTNLLKGLHIYGTFHAIPKAFPEDEEVRNGKHWSIPRYSMSFGSQVDTPMALRRPQPRSLIWNFYHRTRDNCDIVEFGEYYRRKSFAFPTDSWNKLDSINDAESEKISLVDALWSIPRDSISILHTHLLRNASKYSDSECKALTCKQWVQSRLRVLHQLDVFASLSGGLAAALMEQRIEKRHLLAKSTHPFADDYGTMHADESIVRIGEIGGILFHFVSGRERYWHKQEMKHLWKKLQDKRNTTHL
jgi:hypothetical protein